MTVGSAEGGVLALGLGNLLLGDDAAGLRVLEALSPADGAELVDGGTQGLALLGYLEGRRAVLILDAVALGERAGTVHVLRGAEIEGLRARRASTAHEGNALELLEASRLVGAVSGQTRLAVVGIEPARIGTGIGLSREVEAALPAAVEAARRVLEEMRGCA